MLLHYRGVSEFTGLERVDWSTGVDYWTGVLERSCVRSRVDYMCSVFNAVVFTRSYALSLAMLWAKVLQWYADHHTLMCTYTHSQILLS